MTLVYNAHQTHLLLQSHSFLMNKLTCTTYKAYQKHKQNLSSFAAFCREAAVALSKRNKASQPLKPISENIPEASTFEVGSIFSYKKCLHFETEKEWIDLRLSKAKTHIATRIENALQRSCVLCCRLNHDSENQGHSRLGYKTSFECIVCKVSLCRSKRWDDEQSCFEIFHAKAATPVQAFGTLKVHQEEREQSATATKEQVIIARRFTYSSSKSTGWVGTSCPNHAFELQEDDSVSGWNISLRFPSILSMRCHDGI
ncbi:LOW QUALITY PROTEIN: hypothetical protein PHPALM_27841 [Phytophthora palmivora]|uniref:Uncharacterized protein n=1 Tax=Phytophthora palmivora TaxID=4796 RepID=A0A2P4XBM1_9STRA|nr:LOW QUALITY PROTEIN: hypothetical protein PHPALM_27841 [Phytophthora palmivora]